MNKYITAGVAMQQSIQLTYLTPFLELWGGSELFFKGWQRREGASSLREIEPGFTFSGVCF